MYIFQHFPNHRYICSVICKPLLLVSWLGKLKIFVSVTFYYVMFRADILPYPIIKESRCPSYIFCSDEKCTVCYYLN